MRIATMAREAEHRGMPTTSVKRTVTCLRSASMGAFSCKMLDEKICRAVVVTFAVALQQKLLKQALSLFEIARVEPRGKPAVDGTRSSRASSRFPLIAPEPRHAHPIRLFHLGPCFDLMRS